MPSASGPTDFAKWQEYANTIPSAEDDDKANGANNEDDGEVKSKNEYLKAVINEELRPFCAENKIAPPLQLCLAIKENMVDMVEELLKNKV